MARISGIDNAWGHDDVEAGLPLSTLLRLESDESTLPIEIRLALLAGVPSDEDPLSLTSSASCVRWGGPITSRLLLFQALTRSSRSAIHRSRDMSVRSQGHSSLHVSSIFNISETIQPTTPLPSMFPEGINWVHGISGRSLDAIVEADLRSRERRVSRRRPAASNFRNRSSPVNSS